MSKLEALIAAVLEGDKALGDNAARAAGESLEGELAGIQADPRYAADPAFRRAVHVVREGYDAHQAAGGHVEGGDPRGATMTAEQLGQGFGQLRYARSRANADPTDWKAREAYERAGAQLDGLVRSWEAANGKRLDEAIDLSPFTEITDNDLQAMREIEESGGRWEEHEGLQHLARFGSPKPPEDGGTE